MQKIRIIVTSMQKVVREGVALILGANENFEIIGHEGAGIIDEASKLQPDLIVFILNSKVNAELETLKKLKEMCRWTKFIVFSELPVERSIHNKLMHMCDGYLQKPILPGFLLKAVELVCYSGYFCFLGSVSSNKSEVNADESNKILPLNFSSKTN